MLPVDEFGKKKKKQSKPSGQMSPDVNVYNLDMSTPLVPQGLQRTTCDQYYKI
jgi:hypothetical protein